MDWIAMYIHCQILLINRNPHDYLKTQSRMRHKGPLSPYLFNLAMETQSMMVKKAKRLNVFKGMKFRRSGVEKK